MLNILTFDIEDWYHANYNSVNLSSSIPLEERVQESTRKILALLRETNNKATFFILGQVAEKLPHLIREIQKDGHEIASHGYNHQLVYKQNEIEFRKDILKAKKILESICDKEIIGYRAPSWSLCDQRTPWAWRVLKESGYLYDSSLFPFKTYLYGDNHIPPIIHSRDIDKNNFILEIPPSIAIYKNIRIPIAGGFYFRFFPYPFTRRIIGKMNMCGRKAVLYLHPRELDPTQPKLKLNRKDFFIHYFNIKNTEKKLRHLLMDFKFAPIYRLVF